MVGLTQRQQMVLDFIRQSITDRGYPPTLREIGARMGIRSTNGVNDHLRALERKGYLRREDMKSRALRPISPETARGTTPELPGLNGSSTGANGSVIHGDFGQGSSNSSANDDFMDVQILGRVAA